MNQVDVQKYSLLIVHRHANDTLDAAVSVRMLMGISSSKPLQVMSVGSPPAAVTSRSHVVMPALFDLSLLFPALCRLRLCVLQIGVHRSSRLRPRANEDVLELGLRGGCGCSGLACASVRLEELLAALLRRATSTRGQQTDACAAKAHAAVPRDGARSQRTVARWRRENDGRRGRSDDQGRSAGYSVSTNMRGDGRSAY
jgi:hypothetical protein